MKKSLIFAPLALSAVAFGQTGPAISIGGPIGITGGASLTGLTPITLADADRTLTPNEWWAGTLSIGGTATAPRTITLPLNVGQSYIVKNALPQSITLKGVTGASVTVLSGGLIQIICDGTGYYALGGGTQTNATAAPTANPAAGTYTAAQSVSLADSTPGALIYYTLDGSAPTTGSTRYSTPIPVSANTTIKALAVADGYTNSAISTFAYTISASGAAHMELASAGQNANMNGAKPFVGSHAYDDISQLPVDTANNQYVQAAIANSHLDVSQPTGSDSSIYYFVLNSATDKGVYWVPGQTSYDENGGFDPESDHTLIPFKHGIVGEGGVDITVCRQQGSGDNHGVILDVNPANTVAYEMYDVQVCNGIAKYYSLTVRNLNHPFEVQGPKGRTSTDVAGMVIAPPVLGTRYEDYINGTWSHAVRWTMHLASKAPNGYATLYTGLGAHGGCNGGNCSDGRATVFGQRMRLKASYNCVTAPNGNAWSMQAQITCQGLKKYGAINSDNGINMAVQGSYDARWADPGELNQILGTDFETVMDATVSGAYAAQVIDETDNGGTSTVIDQTNIFNYSGGAGPVVTNPSPRPTIVSFTPSATSITVGQPVTFNYVATNATVVMIDNAGGTAYGNTGSITWTPSQTASYRLTVLGQYGWITGAPITVTVTGPQAPAPTSNVQTGTYTTPQTVTLSSTCAQCQILYTTDGTTPGQYSTLYTGPIVIQNNGANVLKAITVGVQQGFLASNVSEFDITLNLPNAAAPVFTPAPGSFAGATSVSMTTATTGAGIYYTVDGTTPTASSKFYSTPLAITYTAGVQTRTQLQAATIKYGYGSTYTSGIYLTGTQGALNGTPTSLITYGTGVFNQAGVFSSSSASPYTYITLPPGFSPLNPTDGFTIDARIKTSSTGIQWIFGNGDEQGGGLAIACRYGNYMTYIPGYGEFNSGITVADGNWHYVKTTFSSAGVKTFVDGVAGAATTQVTTSVAAGSTAFTQYEIGATNQGRFGFSGMIDELAIRTGVDNSLTVPSAAYTGTETGMFALYHLDNNATDSTSR